MDIIIKGTDDFNCCTDCPCYNEEGHPYCQVLWDEYSNFRDKHIRCDDKCPVLKLKDDHHYIDATRLIAVMKSVIPPYKQASFFYDIVKLIEHQPDIRDTEVEE